MLDEQEAVSYFGEVPLLQNHDRREASVLAIVPCSLFSFSKHNLTELLGLFPSVQQVLQKMASERAQRLNEARSVLMAKRMATKWVLKRHAKDPESPDQHEPEAGAGMSTLSGSWRRQHSANQTSETGDVDLTA